MAQTFLRTLARQRTIGNILLAVAIFDSDVGTIANARICTRFECVPSRSGDIADWLDTLKGRGSTSVSVERKRLVPSVSPHLAARCVLP